jgi:choline kinase
MLFGGRDRRTKEAAEQPRLAVILAAAQGTRLQGLAGGVSKGFLRVGGRPLVHWSIQKLLAVGVERVVIVTGHGAEAYENMAEKWTAMQTVRNPEYAESGSMYSLYCARDQIEGTFLLLESDLLYEMRALEALVAAPQPNAVLLSGLTDLGDARYVDAK